MRSNLRRKLLRAALQLLIISFITLGLLEIGLRVCHWVRPSFAFPDYSYNRWRGTPRETVWGFQLNDSGFMDVQFNDNKAEGVFRILGMGDSHVFGLVPYDFNSLTVLERELNKKVRKPRVEVINMGIPGIGPRHYLALLKAEGLQLSPDLVIIYFCIGNDFTNSKPATILQEYSYTAGLIKYVHSMWELRSPTFGEVPGYGTSAAAYEEERPNIPCDKFIETLARFSSIYVKNQKTPWSTYLAYADFYMGAIKDLCDANNLPLLVVLLPDQVQFHRDLQVEVFQWLRSHRWKDLKEDELDFLQPNREFGRRLEKRGIQYLDLFETFSRSARNQRLFLPCDGHWNKLGNRVVATAVEQYLLDHRCLQPGLKP